MFNQCPICFNETDKVYDLSGQKICPECYIKATSGEVTPVPDIIEPTPITEEPVIVAGQVKRDPTNHCPYFSCGSDQIELKSLDEFGTKEYRCLVCLNLFKETREGDIYLYDKVKEEWKLEAERLKPGLPVNFKKVD